MRNLNSIAAVKDSWFHGRYRAPLVDSYNFANIPAWIKDWFSPDEKHCPLVKELNSNRHQNFRNIAFILVDGFGWEMFEKWHDRIPSLKSISSDATVSKITAQFPSTTAAQVSTALFALPVSQHGIVEWFYYEPLYDGVIAPLPFSWAGDQTCNTLASLNVDPGELFPFKTIFSQLFYLGISSFSFMQKDIANSPFTKAATKGSHVMPFNNYFEGLCSLRDTIVSSQGQNYFYFYLDAIDSRSHRNGPEAPETFVTTREVFDIIESQLIGPLRDRANDTLIIITADHGQTAVEPPKAHYLNQIIPNIQHFLKLRQNGDPILFGGSPRDLFFYIKDTMIDRAKEEIEAKLIGVADVFKTDELVAANIFGETPVSPRFSERFGNLLILPYPHEQVFWFEKNRFDCHHLGHHGGLSPEEMDIPFIALEL